MASLPSSNEYQNIYVRCKFKFDGDWTEFATLLAQKWKKNASHSELLCKEWLFLSQIVEISILVYALIIVSPNGVMTALLGDLNCVVWNPLTKFAVIKYTKALLKYRLTDSYLCINF